MEKERQILVIFPHPDDEAFGVSGTLALHIQNGTSVTYACLTLGEMGRNLGNPPFATRESLPHIRKVELQNAAKSIGIQDLRMLGYRDKTVEFEDPEKLADHMGEIIADVNPSLIITFYPGYSVHPDHDATGAAVVKAVGRLAPEKRPTLHCVAFSKNSLDELGAPDIVNDVTVVSDQKIATIKAHASQTQLMIQNMAEKLKANDPDMIAWVNNERFWTYKF